MSNTVNLLTFDASFSADSSPTLPLKYVAYLCIYFPLFDDDATKDDIEKVKNQLCWAFSCHVNKIHVKSKITDKNNIFF